MLSSILLQSYFLQGVFCKSIISISWIFDEPSDLLFLVVDATHLQTSE